MSEFRRSIADGDLISEVKKFGGWWLFGKEYWSPYRNLSREVRFLEQRMHDHHAAYKAAQEDFVVAQKNVQTDIDVLRMYKMDNSEVAYITPSNESILDRRDGIKYSGGNNSGQKQKGQGGGNGNGQQGNQNGQNNGQNNNKQQHGRKAMTMLELLTNAKIVLH